MDRIRAKAWRFDFVLEIGPFLAREDIGILVRSILDEAHDKIAICGLEQSFFFCDLPENGVVNISGFLHTSSDIWKSTVSTWLCDDRIKNQIWTEVQPGRTGNWKENNSIKEILTACGSRLLHDWKGKTSASVNKGGRPRKAPVLADGGPGEGGAAAAAPRP